MRLLNTPCFVFVFKKIWIVYMNPRLNAFKEGLLSKLQNSDVDNLL